MKLFYKLLGYKIIKIKNIWDADNIMDDVFNDNPEVIFYVHVKKRYLAYKALK
jgi:hypothetical protein